MTKNTKKYVKTAFEKICRQFGISPKSDFRFMRGEKNKDGSFYHLDFVDSSPTNWFCPNTAKGLTRAGLSRINQSIEAFVYCVLGAQINLRSSILGNGGRAKEAQQEFLTLVEDAIRQPDLAKSVQRYQLAVQEAKIRLNFAVCPGGWLMPARMIINTESVVGYNNKLKQATADMKLDVNDDVNSPTKKTGVTHMDDTQSKNKRPSSHPADNRPVKKATTPPTSPTTPTTPTTPTSPTSPTTSSSQSDDGNRLLLFATVSLAGFALIHFSS